MNTNYGTDYNLLRLSKSMDYTNPNTILTLRMFCGKLISVQIIVRGSKGTRYLPYKIESFAAGSFKARSLVNSLRRLRKTLNTTWEAHFDT